MKTFVSSIILMFTLLQNVYSLDTNLIQFLPLKIGNVWVYNCNNPYPYGTYEKIKIKIIDTVLHSNKRYFTYTTTVVHISGYGSCNAFTIFNGNPLRIDSLTGGVYQYVDSGGCAYSPNEIMVDSFGANVNDTVKIYCGGPIFYGAYRCIGIAEDSIFGLHNTACYYTSFFFEGGSDRNYLKGIGMKYNATGAVNSWTFQYLMGCVIDGVLYGDTTLPVGLQSTSVEIPDQFSLSQNYPNPFNPTTKIKFDIPSNVKSEKSNVKIIVYDVLGREITTLVNEHLNPGTYEVEWDGTNYPSGVYFYKLNAEDYIETKKMVLIK